ncbi:MAG TPA: alpha/beta hydrolase [Candidatus Methylomirabilis sp.]
MPHLEVDGLRLHYRKGGGETGRAAVFVHGAGGNGGHWQAQVDALPAVWRGLALDLPGHGDSAGTGCRTIPAYRDVVVAFLRAAAAGPAVLVGHSMGGAITQAVALAEPELLRGIVLVGTGARLRVHPNILETIRRDHAEVARLVAGWGFGPGAPEATRAESIPDFLRCPAAVSEGDFRACDAFDVMAEVAQVQVPALIVCGEQDALTPPKYARFLHERIAGSRLVLVPDAGHYVMREQPAAVNRALTEFLRTLPGGP